jgi:hypothetical protein
MENRSRALALLLFPALALQNCAHSPPTERHPASAPYPITVLGGDESSLTPDVSGPVVDDPGQVDVVVVGAGLSGLSAATWVSDKKFSVLLLEKEPTLGGLASGSSAQGARGIVRFDRGAAYWTDPFEEEQKILDHIGLGNYMKKYPIPEPIDNFLWNGELYEGIWDPKTLDRLPASFTLYKHELQKANDEGYIPNQPIEEGLPVPGSARPSDPMKLDTIDTATWIRSMPDSAAKRTDPESVKIYKRFQDEIASGKLDAKDPMIGVIYLMDLYCRSALGTVSKYVSAIAFANFYISEIVTRYTTPIGTAQAAENMKNMLEKRKKHVRMLTSAPVGSIVNFDDHAEVTYAYEGQNHRVHARYVIWAAQLHGAVKAIQDFNEKAPEQAGLMSALGYADYSVHNVKTKGHPYRASYDTWVWQPDSTVDQFTDFILGRWMDPEIHGYLKYRDYKTDPPDDLGVFTIYHPLPPSYVGRGYTKEQATQIAQDAVDRLVNVIMPIAAPGHPVNVTSVETNRWAYSVHIAEPGHYLNKAKILRQRFGRVFFGHNNIGTPAFEEALFRGHCAAVNVLTRLKKNYKREKWSNCPIEN